MEQIQKDCAAELERRINNGEIRDARIESEIRDQIEKIKENPAKWVFDWIDDPYELVEQVLWTYSFNHSNYEAVGLILNQLIKSKIRKVAEHIVDSED